MSPVRMGKFEEAMRVVLEYKETFNQQDVTSIMTLLSDDCVYEHYAPASDGASYKGKEAITLFWEGFFRESPGIQMKAEDMFSSGQRCVMQWRCEWADGHVRGVDVFKVRDGLIVEQLSYVKG